MEEFDNLFASIKEAKVLNKELNPFGYKEGEYPEPGEMIDFMLRNNAEPAKEIDLEELAVNGLVLDEPMEDYLASDHLPSSALKEALKNPASFFFYMNDKKRMVKKSEKHFELGTFAHMAFLEPELFNMVETEPKASLASKDGVKKLIVFYERLNKVPEPKGEKCDLWGIGDMKSYLEGLKANCKYQIIQEEHKLIVDILKRNYYRYGGGIIPMIMKGAKSEVSFYGEDEETGLTVRVRPDGFNTADNIGVNAIISFKTTSADNIGKFIYDSAKYQYELSEGMYQEVVSNITGRNFNVTIMVMLQTVPPFLPAVLWWSPEDLQNGKYKYHYALNVIKDCKASGLYPGFEALAESGNFGIINMQLPEWSKKLIQPVDISED